MHEMHGGKMMNFTAIRDIWDMFIAALLKYYIPGPSMTVDEQLVPFRGRCPFHHYMASINQLNTASRFGGTVTVREAIR